MAADRAHAQGVPLQNRIWAQNHCSSTAFSNGFGPDLGISVSRSRWHDRTFVTCLLPVCYTFVTCLLYVCRHLSTTCQPLVNVCAPFVLHLLPVCYAFVTHVSTNQSFVTRLLTTCQPFVDTCYPFVDTCYPCVAGPPPHPFVQHLLPTCHLFVDVCHLFVIRLSTLVQQVSISAQNA